MKMAATCGAITGALMVIGLLGGGDEEYRAFMTAMKQNHEGMTNCGDLLKKERRAGRSKKSLTATAWSMRPLKMWSRC